MLHTSFLSWERGSGVSKIKNACALKLIKVQDPKMPRTRGLGSSSYHLCVTLMSGQSGRTSCTFIVLTVTVGMTGHTGSFKWLRTQ